jgi:ribonuclease HII
MIVGIDEVGRGAWAGPLVVGAVLLGGVTIDGLTDSKLLTKKQRIALDLEIRQKALGVGVGWVSARQIDQIGLTAALKLAAARAIMHIRHEYHEIIVDGTIALINDPRVTLLKKADLLIPSVSAASIVAKVARDNYMKHLDQIFPGYKFAGHVGYGTAVHRQAIADQGVTPLHRLSFAPLQKYHNNVSVSALRLSPRVTTRAAAPTESSALTRANVGADASAEPASATRTTKKIGDAAEAQTENYLKRHGHKILERNWRTKFCEIDIVSSYDNTVFFTEVKYRKNDNQGGGLAAITTKKQRQMKFAAEYYAVKNRLVDTNLLLAAADVAGQPPVVQDFLVLG